MTTKQKEVAEQKPELTADGREVTIASEPDTTFDERTGAGTPPWQREDGSQDNGAADTTSETK